MRGIVDIATYLPRFVLDRAEITRFVGTGGGKGTRRVASYDQDSVTLAVEACRNLGPLALGENDAAWFVSTAPPYLDKTNATTLHAALHLDSVVGAYDAVGSIRAAVGTLRAALCGSGTALLAAGDVRAGWAGSTDEANGGDAGAAVLVGDGNTGAVIAELLAARSASAEFLERWRSLADSRSKHWEERFAEVEYPPLVRDVWSKALLATGLEHVDVAAISGYHARAAKAAGALVGKSATTMVDTHTDVIGNPAAAHPFLALAAALEAAEPGHTVALVVLADGVDVLIFRATDALATRAAQLPAQLAATKPLPYGRFLAWRGVLPVEPPRRPEPARVSAPAAARSTEWKFGFVGARDNATQELSLPPQRVGRSSGSIDDSTPAPMADALGTIAAFTVDRLAYSQSPPVIFAVVDFEGGGRYPLELTDCSPDEVSVGAGVAMTFRRLSSADGIHNYFWKGRLI